MKGNVLKPNPEYLTVWLGLYCKPNAISPLCLVLRNTCCLYILSITTKTCAQLQNTYKDRSTNFSGILRECWVTWLLQSRHQICCTSIYSPENTVHMRCGPFIFSALFPSTCFCKRNAWWSCKSSESIFSRTTYKNWSVWRKFLFIIIKDDYRCILGFDYEAQTLFYLKPYFP